ncbi:hypothetical protein B0J17DRAFT_713918 [Rhizoctonia solani]|nr:hypothetical protein B0J17DRAFT_713918 [Rhizoctonia solani]
MEVVTDVIPGDIVAVNVDHSRREGLVVGHHYDALGRHIVEVQLDGYPNTTMLGAHPLSQSILKYT